MIDPAAILNGTISGLLTVVILVLFIIACAEFTKRGGLRDRLRKRMRR
jgi:hypothetical protein